jgi:hypothetical protein
MASLHDFLLNLKDNKASTADFNAAAKAQKVVEATYHSAAQDGAWIRLDR